MERDGRFTAGPLRAFVAWMVWVGGSMALPAFPFVAVMAGLAITYAIGLLWLLKFVPAGQVIALGFAPFILGDLINIAMVALGARALPRRFMGRIGQ